jgi:PTH2 family peptidyl-tRNA hydrolase
MDIKQVIVMRKDLKMRRGKEIAQGSHACMIFLLKNRKLTPVEEKWVKGNFKKVCLQIDSEERLVEIHKKALELGLESNLVIDSGVTEFNGVPTKTCLAIGPDYSDKIDVLTGTLKLY